MAPEETTVDPAELRGLVTARPWIVSKLPHSSNGRGEGSLPGNGFLRVLQTVSAPPTIPSESSVFEEAAELAREGGDDDLLRLAASGEP